MQICTPYIKYFIIVELVDRTGPEPPHPPNFEFCLYVKFNNAKNFYGNYICYIQNKYICNKFFWLLSFPNI